MPICSHDYSTGSHPLGHSHASPGWMEGWAEGPEVLTEQLILRMQSDSLAHQRCRFSLCAGWILFPLLPLNHSQWEQEVVVLVRERQPLRRAPS